MLKKKIITRGFSLLGIGLLMGVPVLAQETQENLSPQEVRQQRTEERRQEARQRAEEREQEMLERREERRGEVEQRRQEMRQDVNEYRAERFERYYGHVQQRVENLIAKLEELGADVVTLQEQQKMMDEKAAATQESLVALDEAIKSQDDKTIEEARRNVLSSRKDLREYYTKTLRPALKDVVESVRN